MNGEGSYEISVNVGLKSLCNISKILVKFLLRYNMDLVLMFR